MLKWLPLTRHILGLPTPLLAGSQVRRSFLEDGGRGWNDLRTSLNTLILRTSDLQGILGPRMP